MLITSVRILISVNQRERLATFSSRRRRLPHTWSRSSSVDLFRRRLAPQLERVPYTCFQTLTAWTNCNTSPTRLRSCCRPWRSLRKCDTSYPNWTCSPYRISSRTQWATGDWIPFGNYTVTSIIVLCTIMFLFDIS